MRRGLWVGLGLLGSIVVAAQEKKPAGPVTATETAQWRAYAEQLETDLQGKARGLAQCAATMQAYRTEIERLQKLVAEPKPKP